MFAIEICLPFKSNNAVANNVIIQVIVNTKNCIQSVGWGEYRIYSVIPCIIYSKAGCGSLQCNN